MYNNRRRGMIPQISINDEGQPNRGYLGDAHDVYGSRGAARSTTRPLSFISSPSEETLGRRDYVGQHPIGLESERPGSISPGSISSGSQPPRTDRYTSLPNGDRPQAHRQRSFGGSSHDSQSPPRLVRSPSATETATHHFPLNDIDYESSPAAVAQELNNLQAIRRMSMNQGAAADPDLPSFLPGFGVPSVAPPTAADADDTSRLFWVPARLHPELAPKEFKTFVEDRVERIRRKSGEDERHLGGGIERRASGSSGLGRRKSTLSHLIDNPQGYQDGAERLERKRSQNQQHNDSETEATLHDLEALVSSPDDLVRIASNEAGRRSSTELGSEDDMPILPPVASLKRSTRTNYRGGSMRRGERVLPPRRPVGKPLEASLPTSAAPPFVPEPNTYIPTEDPLDGASPLLFPRTQPPFTDINQIQQPAGVERPSTWLSYRPKNLPPLPTSTEDSQPQPQPGITSLNIQSIPTHHISSPSADASSDLQPSEVRSLPPPSSLPLSLSNPTQLILPERRSSHEFSRPAAANRSQTQGPAPSPRPPARPPISRPKTYEKTLNDVANNPAPLPGMSTSTEAISIIPTLPEEDKSEKKSKERPSDGTTRKTSWGWLLGSDDKDVGKKSKEDKDAGKRHKTKQVKTNDKTHDSARLDLLQTTAEEPRGRESLVLDRSTLRLEEERRKDSHRKRSGSDVKKEKDSGGGASIFSSFFGSRKKSDRDLRRQAADAAAAAARTASPEPRARLLRADIDYNWTRFSILEERAIYRMAHIKLANPRRALLSQVLLSNFMYSYLAKVQQMHPQSQVSHYAATDAADDKAGANDDATQDQPYQYLEWQLYHEVSQSTTFHYPTNPYPQNPH